MTASYQLVSGVGVEIRTTPENPSFNLNSPDAWDYFEMTPSLSGIRVNAEEALKYSPWWRGVSLIAGDVGKLSLSVMKRVEGVRNLEHDREHIAYPLARWKPNPYQTAMVFREQLTAHAVNRGNAFAYIERNGDGSPRYLWPIHPDRCYAMTEPGSRTFELYYVVTDDRGTPVAKLRAADVIHIRGLTDDGITGMVPYEMARDELGLAIGLRRFQEVFFKNAARPSVVLETGGTLSPDQVQRLRDSWDKLYTGVHNMHKTVILTQGLQAKPLPFSAQDSEVNATRQMSVKDVSNRLGIPLHKLGDTAARSYASLEQENLSYLQECLDRWLKSWEYELRDKLLSEAEKADDTHCFLFDRDELIATDSLTKAQVHRIYTAGAPVMTQNEARALLNLPPMDGAADELLTPANMAATAADGALDGGDPEDSDEGEPTIPGDDGATNSLGDDARAAAVAKLEEDERRAVKRLAVAAIKAAKEPNGFLAAVDALAVQHEPHVREITAGANRIMRAVGLRHDFDSYVVGLIDSVQGELIELAGKVTAAELLPAVKRWAKSKGVDDA